MRGCFRGFFFGSIISCRACLARDAAHRHRRLADIVSRNDGLELRTYISEFRVTNNPVRITLSYEHDFVVFGLFRLVNFTSKEYRGTLT